jgi:hypothetical protein
MSVNKDGALCAGIDDSRQPLFASCQWRLATDVAIAAWRGFMVESMSASPKQRARLSIATNRR